MPFDYPLHHKTEKKKKKQTSERGEKKKRGFEFESRSLVFFTLVGPWDRQDRSMWFSYDFSDRYDCWSGKLPIAENVEIETWRS